MDPSSSPVTSPASPPPHNPYAECTITNPTTFSAWLDDIGPSNTNLITHLTLLPSQHLRRIVSLSSLGDTLGDSIGDTLTFSELQSWIALLQRLANLATGIRSLTVFFAADVSGGDTHRYRRGVGECLGFVWAIGKFNGLDYVDLQGYFPLQWPYYLRGVWGEEGTRIYNSNPAPEGLLWQWRQGTERLDPRDFGWQ
ncbi:hypothetical protein SBOR_2545 [Sclerotinia borealis F-4128]|uniref:Chitinase n=1 Tax=Sclerotinia borealis (strain F-4128) TaxID=1432307 RepID=W9CR23_SCLBF|nr:hypothetical protein SBOR_2545 [Sclerotinia borealis F-4128]